MKNTDPYTQEKKQPRSIAIIGAGIAGLAAGCYAQMNGYRTQIFEMHTLPGGLCTSWKRKGYTFDGCIHWLVGSGPGSGYNRVWQELGAVQGHTMVNHKEFMRVVGPEGQQFIVYTDIGRLERHMHELAPADSRTIHTFCSAARRMARVALKMDVTSGRIRSLLAVLPALPTFIRYGKTSVQSFAKRFRDPFLRQAFNTSLICPIFR